jgi:hypothetical protein
VPLNVSSNSQTKEGGLIVGGLRAVLQLVIGDSRTSLSTTIVDNPTQTYFAKRSSGQALIDINPESAAGQPAFVRFFRTTNTNASAKSVDFMKGDGTAYVDSRISVGGGNSHFNLSGGNVGFGILFPASKVDVAGDVCWTPTGLPRRCLGGFDPTDGGGDGTAVNYWTKTGNDIQNNNAGQVQIAGKIKVAGGNPGINKLLVGEDATGLARWRTLDQVMTDTGMGGDGLGKSVLNTTFSGCNSASVIQGCPIQTGDSGPTARLVKVLDVGSLQMTCPTGYKVVSGGAECDNSINLGVAASGAMLNASRPIDSRTWEVQCNRVTFTVVALFFDKTINAMKQASITCAK